MDLNRWWKIGGLFYKIKNFTSFSEENCPGNVTFKETLIAAQFKKVILSNFSRLKLSDLLGNNSWNIFGLI